MSRLQREMNRMFNRYRTSDQSLWSSGGYPALNLWEDDESLYVEAEIPGLKLEDLEIFVSGGDHLSLKGKRARPTIEKSTWHRREREQGNFARMVELPQPVDSEKVQADLVNGVLTIVLPKRAEAKPRRIHVKSE
jgi:HSP20 family protein